VLVVALSDSLAPLFDCGASIWVALVICDKIVYVLVAFRQLISNSRSGKIRIDDCALRCCGRLGTGTSPKGWDPKLVVCGNDSFSACIGCVIVKISSKNS